MQKAVLLHKKSMKYNILKRTTPLKLNDKNYKIWVNYVMSSLRAKRQWKMISETYSKSQKNEKKISEFIEKLKKWDTVD